jgi:branched-subunit amino acid aminotransferase/4-amino-4-deoxychorismate lyase
LAGAPAVALNETCRVVAGRPWPDAVPLWQWHEARLLAGGCGRPLLSRAAASAREAVAGGTRTHGRRLRLTVTVRPDGDVNSVVERRLSSLDVPGGPVLAMVHVPEAPDLPPGPAKPADRSAWDHAMSQARRLGAHQALLVDSSGHVVDGATASLWLVARGMLVTPPAPPAVPGVARAWLLEHAGALGLNARAEALLPEDLDLAEEVFLTNAFGGCVAARGRGGAVTSRVSEAFASLWE